MSNPIKIAFLMQESRMGGIEYNSLHLAQALDPQQVAITFLCPGIGKLVGQLDERGMSHLFYARPRLLPTSMRLGKMALFNPAAVLYDLAVMPGIAGSISRLLREHGFQAVVTKGLLANFYGGLAARRAGIPCVWDMQEIVSKKKVGGLLSWCLSRWAAAYADKILVSSAAIRDQFAPKVRSKTELIPNGVDLTDYRPENYDPEEVRQEWHIEPGQVLMGHIARFTPWKGQLEFLKAARLVADKVPHARFAVVGAPVFDRDDYARQLRETTQALGLENLVIFPGFREDLAAVLAALDIFVHTATEPEGCPITLLTAMAMAKPVVVTRIDGHVEIIPDASYGVLVPPARPQALASALAELCQDKNRVRTLGAKARERVLQRHAMETYARESTRVFRAVV